jgi:hypothetical protein
MIIIFRITGILNGGRRSSEQDTENGVQVEEAEDQSLKKS